MASDLPIILSLDTAMNGCGVGLYDAGAPQRSVSRYVPMLRGQAEALLPLVQEVLGEAGYTFADIGLIAVTIGPGAFTGLRVGLSAARSLALALDVPLAGVTTLEALAQGYLEEHALDDRALGVLVETKRSDYYFQSFSEEGTPLSEPLALDLETVWDQTKMHRSVLIGDAVARFVEEGETLLQSEETSGALFLQEYDHVQPLVLAKCALVKYRQGQQGADPLYLRGADVSQPKVSARILA